ncbi:MAG: hypothetical protein K9K81_11430 [Desulfobacteraceae bacterium]|nr:hypothetical protein [Desulfobacteraceae bacterium]
MNFLFFIKAIALLLAAGILGNWFLSEVKKAKIRKDPWYKPYLSTPGLMIIAIIVLFPLLVWLIRS